MTSTDRTTSEASGSTTPEASAVLDFITVTNTVVIMLGVLVDEIRSREPHAATMVEGYTALVSGEALQVISRWPS